MMANANANLGGWWPSLLHGKSERKTYVTCLIIGLSDFPPQSSLATGRPEYIQYEVVAQNNVSLSLSNTCSVQTLPMRLSLGENRFCPTIFLFSHQALHWVDYIALSRGKNWQKGWAVNKHSHRQQKNWTFFIGSKQVIQGWVASTIEGQLYPVKY